MKIEDPRPQLIKSCALILMFITLLPTILVPIFVEQTIYFSVAGLVNFLIFSMMFVFFHRATPKPWHRYLLFSVGMLSLLPLLLVSGGVNSQFSPLLPLLPMIIGLLSNSRDSKISCVFIICFILTCLYFHDYIWDWTNEPVSIDKTRSRAIWLALTTLVSTGFTEIFLRTNRQLRQALTTRAYQDELTGLSNRRNIMELLEAKAPNTEIAVLMVDVDNFKVLNDTYGHQFGDYCLQSVAKCIQDSIRADVGKVGRYGGEEFLVVITDPTKSSVQRTAEEIRKNIAKLTLMHEDKERVKITATIGWHFSAQAESVSSMINLADKALYLGKNLGRNKVVSSSDL